MSTTKYYMIDPSMKCPRCGCGMYPRTTQLKDCVNHQFFCRDCEYHTPDWLICLDGEVALETWRKYTANPLVIAFWHAENAVMRTIGNILYGTRDAVEDVAASAQKQAKKIRVCMEERIRVYEEKIRGFIVGNVLLKGGITWAR